MIKLAPAGLKDDIEMRKVYAGFIAGQIEAGSPIIALEADLMSSMAMDSVARDYPQHVINCGIMEANVIGTAAGLALTGRKPFVHTFTAFASRRCFDLLQLARRLQRLRHHNAVGDKRNIIALAQYVALANGKGRAWRIDTPRLLTDGTQPVKTVQVH